MSRIITTVALLCVVIAIGMAAVKWNESSPPSAQNPMLTPQNPMLTPQNPTLAPGTTANMVGAPGQPAVLEQRVVPNGVPPAGAGLSPTPVLTPERPAYAPMPPQQQLVTTEQPEKVIVEKRVVYVRPRNRIHIGRTLYETAHHVLNLPNRILGP